MSKWRAHSSARALSICLVLGLLVLAGGFASAQSRDAPTSVIELAKLTASAGAQGDYSGRSVSISGPVLVAGSHGDDDNADGSGSVYVFVRSEPVAWVCLPVILRGAPG